MSATRRFRRVPSNLSSPTAVSRLADPSSVVDAIIAEGPVEREAARERSGAGFSVRTRSLVPTSLFVSLCRAQNAADAGTKWRTGGRSDSCTVTGAKSKRGLRRSLAANSIRGWNSIHDGPGQPERTRSKEFVSMPAVSFPALPPTFSTLSLF